MKQIILKVISKYIKYKKRLEEVSMDIQKENDG